MLVSMWMSRDVFVVPPEMPIAEAAGEMARHRVRRLPVVDSRGPGPRLVGMISLLDLTRAFPPDVNPLSALAGERGPREPVSSIMSLHVRTIDPDAPIGDAARLLLDEEIGALPVVRDGALIGIITESDLLRAFVAAISGDGPGVWITFNLAPGDEVIALAMDIAGRHAMVVVSALSLERQGRRLGVVRLRGREVDGFVADLWQSGHPVLSVAPA
jgi:acetoin utilization protein AcuB